MMPIKQRPYRSSDLEHVCNLALAFPETTFHIVDLPYRLSSSWLNRGLNTAVWEDEHGALIGFAALQPAWYAFDFIYHSQLPDMQKLILAWGVERCTQIARENGEDIPFLVDVREGESSQVALLEAFGFINASSDWTQVLLKHSLKASLPEPQLPSGFNLRHLAGKHEVGKYVEAHRAAFGSTWMTVEWREQTLETPQYQPELDLVIEAPDGRFAAFCVCWLAPARWGNTGLKVGQIEPLGTHPDFQKQGLGRAIIAEALRRFKAHGADLALVETDTFRDAAYALYTSSGFELAYRILKYGREF